MKKERKVYEEPRKILNILHFEKQLTQYVVNVFVKDYIIFVW